MNEPTDAEVPSTQHRQGTGGAFALSVRAFMVVVHLVDGLLGWVTELKVGIALNVRDGSHAARAYYEEPVRRIIASNPTPSCPCAMRNLSPG
jgi:hypothetical protein